LGRRQTKREKMEGTTKSDRSPGGERRVGKDQEKKEKEFFNGWGEGKYNLLNETLKKH